MARIDAQEILAQLIAVSRAAGADAADALFVESVASSISYRLGKLEDAERAEANDLGLRVFVGQKVAFVSSTDFSRDALAQLPERAVAMARPCSQASNSRQPGLRVESRAARSS